MRQFQTGSRVLKLLIFCFTLLIIRFVQADNSVLVVDSSGASVVLKQSAKRIIALSPHTVENVYSAGAGDYLVGVVAYSDYPKAATGLPQIGSNNVLNYEAIIALKPDLIIAWQSGNTRSSLQRLKNLGFNLYIDEPRKLTDIAKSIRNIGILAGTSARANRVANSYLLQLQQLKRDYQRSNLVTVFYQIWHQPIQTLNGQHIVNAVIELCGGSNIFADQTVLAPVVGIESIIQQNPQAIIASGAGDQRPAWLDDWLQWSQVSAVRNHHLYHINPDYLHRHTIRILLGARSLCRYLDQVRSD